MVSKKPDLSGFQAIADAEPYYECFEVPGGMVELFDNTPGASRTDGMHIRLTITNENGRHSVQTELFPYLQQQLGLALIANLKE